MSSLRRLTRVVRPLSSRETPTSSTLLTESVAREEAKRYLKKAMARVTGATSLKRPGHI